MFCFATLLGSTRLKLLEECATPPDTANMHRVCLAHHQKCFSFGRADALASSAVGFLCAFYGLTAFHAPPHQRSSNFKNESTWSAQRWLHRANTVPTPFLSFHLTFHLFFGYLLFIKKADNPFIPFIFTSFPHIQLPFYQSQNIRTGLCESEAEGF